MFSALFAFRAIFVVGGFFTRKFAPAKVLHRYAVLVAARNEETVIGNLIDSIRAQDYPAELVDIFVVADNCTDRTSAICRQHGAICYERFDPEHRTKGFALQFLVENIRRDYGIESYEGYFIFDADNLLKKDYISRMNEAFDAGEKIITSYRNTKNFDSGCVAASYGIHWLRTVRFEHRARSYMHLATRIQGTGYMFAAELIKDGWKFTGLTEDRAFCADAVVNGYKISYNDAAEFYDEQPENLRIAFRQRTRWAKGNLHVTIKTTPALFSHMFVTHGAANRHLKEGEATRKKRLANNLLLRFMSYDMLTVVVPYSLFSFLRNVLLYLLHGALICMSLEYFSAALAPGFLQALLEHFHINVSANSLPSALLLFTLFSLAACLVSYAVSVLTAAFVFLIERRRIMKIKWYKKIWYCLTFPMFEYIGEITSFMALFSKPEWKPIPHISNVTIDEVNEKINTGT